jgi:hypothetical protein
MQNSSQGRYCDKKGPSLPLPWVSCGRSDLVPLKGKNQAVVLGSPGT